MFTFFSTVSLFWTHRRRFLSSFLFLSKVLLSVRHCSSSHLLSQFSLQPSVNHWGNASEELWTRGRKLAETDVPQKQCGRWKERRQEKEIRQKGREREKHNARQNGKQEKAGELWVGWPYPLCCQNKINPAAPTPPGPSGCQSINCPINMSVQTN